MRYTFCRIHFALEKKVFELFYHDGSVPLDMSCFFNDILSTPNGVFQDIYTKERFLNKKICILKKICFQPNCLKSFFTDYYKIG